MKKFLFVLTCLMVSVMMQAGDVSRQEALEKARQFMPNKEFKQQESGQRKAPGIAPMNSPYYVFNAENNGGFVIVSGDDRTEAILGYSDKGELDIETAPDNVKWLLDYYDKVITAMEKLPENSDEQVSSHRKIMANISARKTIEPLLKTQWGQMEPYNKYCPEINGVRYPTGCVATAIAQIVNYNKWPKGLTNATEEYFSRTINISMPALEPTSFDWDNMTDDDIARLMIYCGYGAKIDYNEAGSCGYDNDVKWAFTDIFDYSKGYRLLNRVGYSDDDWELAIYEELAKGRPMYYSGEDGRNGHAWVVDGYENGRFHCNWGWYGKYDGYFLLTGLTTEEDLIFFNKYQLAGICIQPPANVQDTNSPKLYVNETYCSVQNVSRDNLIDQFPEIQYYCTLTNDLAKDITLSIGYGLYHENKLIQVLSQEQHAFTAGESYIYWGFTEINQDIADGTYRIAAVCREKETDNWLMATGSYSHCFKIEVLGNSLSLRSIPDYSAENEDGYIDYGVHTIDGVTYQLAYRYNNYVAEVLPYQQTEQYSGDIYIPDVVKYQGNVFRVYKVSDAFLNCENLTSLSMRIPGMSWYISHCPQLSKVELREGMSWGCPLGSCPSLEEIVLPTTLSNIAYNFLINCENLKTIRFTGEDPLFFETIPDWGASSLPSLTDIYFPMETPPALVRLEWDMRTESNIPVYLDDVPVNSQAKIHIPQGTLKAYQQSQWKNWTFVEDLPAALHEAVTWGYLHGKSWRDAQGRSWSGLAVGMNDNHDIEIAMRVPAEDLILYKGNKITRIELFSMSIESDFETSARDYQYVFITERATDYLVKQSFDVVRGKWNSIELSEPYVITGDELFVGFGRHCNIEEVGGTDETYIPDALWVRAMGGEDDCIYTPGVWYNEGKHPDWGHPQPLRFTIEGENVPQGAVIRELSVIDGTNLNIQAVVRNRSLNNVQSYMVEWTADDGQTGSQTFDTNILPNTSETITIPLPNSLRSGYHTVTFDIPNLNRKTNELKGLNVPTIHLYNGTEAIVVKAKDYSREYGDENPAMEFDIQGLTPNGTPEIVCEATATSPVGAYPIVVKAGSITNENVAYVSGTLTVTKAPLIVTAQDCTMKQGTALPDFTVAYQGFKNGENESVLTKKPVVTTTASTESVAGEYMLMATGAEAQNYDFNYVNGWLQVLLRGDLTGSGSVNVQDATLAVNYILGKKYDKYDYTLADMNDDGEIDVFDVTMMIGAILKEESAAKARKAMGVYVPTADDLLTMESSSEGMMVSIERPERFTSFQMDVEVPVGVALTGARLTNNESGHNVLYSKIGENQYRVMALSMSSTPLKASANGLLELDLTDGGDVQIGNIMFVTPQGEAVLIDALSNNVVTDINSIGISEVEEIYDLSGRKMNVRREQLPKGIYIINQKRVVIK